MMTRVRQASSNALDPVIAVAELAAELGDDNDAVLFFCSPKNNLPALGQALASSFSCPLAGCTSAGQFGAGGFMHSAIAAIGLAGATLRMGSHLIHPITADFSGIAGIACKVQQQIETSPHRHRVGLLLADGMSMAEEALAAQLYASMGDIPMIGGSAGDDQQFDKTFVYDGAGTFVSNAALFVLLETDAPIATAKTQHFRPGAIDLVITDADPASRLIREIDGEPAAQVYAEALGCPLNDLTPELFSRHPLVMQVAGEPFVRSIRSCNPDLSLNCFCSIETGSMVTIGEPQDPHQRLTATLEALGHKVGEPAAIIAFDCILRRIEFEHSGIERSIGELMARHRVFGFSTYGEQYNGIHANQTFTALAIGESHG